MQIFVSSEIPTPPSPRLEERQRNSLSPILSLSGTQDLNNVHKFLTEYVLPLRSQLNTAGSLFGTKFFLMSSHFKMQDALSDILKALREGRKRFPAAMFTSLEPDHLGQA